MSAEPPDQSVRVLRQGRNPQRRACRKARRLEVGMVEPGRTAGPPLVPRRAT